MAWYNPFDWNLFPGSAYGASSVPAGDVFPTDVMRGWEPGFIPLEMINPYRQYGLSSILDVRTAFRLCSPLQAIVSQKAAAFTKGKVIVWNPNTEKPVRGQFKAWDKLFLQPNPFQSGRRFFIQAYSYVQQYGYCVIDPLYPTGFNDIPSELYVIPNWMIEWEQTSTPYFRQSFKPKRAWINYGDRRTELNVDRLIIIRDPASVEYDENTWLPLSRAACLEREVSNIIAALNARGEMITDRGALGILSNASKDSIGHQNVDPTEKEQLQRSVNRGRYGITNGRDKVMVTNADLSFQQMTFDVDQLGLHPEHVACIKSLCNVYGFPFTNLAEGFEGKYNNSSHGRRDFQDTTIDPESIDFFEQLSLGLNQYQQNCETYMDYSGVASVQASQEEKGKGMEAMNNGLQVAWDNGLITRNQWLDKLGEEAIALPEFDKYKWQLSPEELGMVIEEDPNKSKDNGSTDN